MFDDNSLPSTILKNPMLLHHKILEELHSRLSDDASDFIIADPNNSFNFLLEASSSMTANSINYMEKSLESVYPKRAKTTEDLYRHMSDFDYVGLYSTPANITLKLVLDKKYLIDNAIQYNDNYNKVIIPSDTILYVGKYTFGLYYPIEIQINRNTDSINVVYDTTETNPLFTLTNNTLIKTEFNYRELELISILIPVYQFTKEIITEDVVAAEGFNKTYSYSDKFYAIRAYSVKDNIYTELSYTLSEEVYDVTDPTLKLKIIPESNQLNVSLPQIYFTNNKIGNKIELEIFTTKGELNVDISEIPETAIKANFAFSARRTTEYSTILSNVPTIILTPEETVINGGTNGYTYEQLRSYIINDTLHESVPVTPIELTNYFEKKGFSIIKYIDNVTDRIYCAYKVLKDTSGSLIPITSTTLLINSEVINSVDTIIKNIDNSITILPTTLYEYFEDSDTCIPLSTIDYNNLIAKDQDSLIEDINSHTYTRSPFHVRLVMDDKYPLAESFNLLSPKTKDLTFVADNVTMSAQMVAVVTYIEHMDEGTGGYRLRIAVEKSTDFQNIPEEDIVVYMSFTSPTGSKIGKRMTYLGTANNLEVYELICETDYHLTKEYRIGITSLEVNGVQQSQYLDLTSTADIIFLIKPGYFDGVVQNNDIVYDVPSAYGSYIGVVRQKATFEFGQVLNVILNDVNAIWSSEEYAVYESDVYYTYPEDVYEVDSDGALVVTIVDDEVVLNKLHSMGDVVLDDYGVPMIKHNQGTIRFDSNGDPIPSKNRELEYYVNMFQIDAKLYFSEDPIAINYVSNLPTEIVSYLDIIKDASADLLERTELYFRPIRTLGLGTFNLGDNKINKLPLDMAFNLKCFVPNFVYTDSSLLEMIRETAIDVIENALNNTTISLTAIGTTLQTKLSEYINSVDVGGINDSINLQTVTISDTDARASIKQLLYVGANGNTLIKKDVAIEFILAE